MPASPSGGPGAARLDRWLFAVRLFKSRSLATQAVLGGRVHVNDGRVKPAHALRVGDRVGFLRGALEFECTVLELPERRGPASQAQACYAEDPESEARRREYLAARRDAAPHALMRGPRPQTRPDKHARDALRRMKRT